MKAVFFHVIFEQCAREKCHIVPLLHGFSHNGFIGIFLGEDYSILNSCIRAARLSEWYCQRVCAWKNRRDRRKESLFTPIDVDRCTFCQGNISVASAILEEVHSLRVEEIAGKTYSNLGHFRNSLLATGQFTNVFSSYKHRLAATLDVIKIEFIAVCLRQTFAIMSNFDRF